MEIGRGQAAGALPRTLTLLSKQLSSLGEVMPGRGGITLLANKRELPLAARDSPMAGGRRNKAKTALNLQTKS